MFLLHFLFQVVMVCSELSPLSNILLHMDDATSQTLDCCLQQKYGNLIHLKRCQAKIVCLVLGSSDPNYRTKQMEVGDARSFGHESADRDSVP